MLPHEIQPHPAVDHARDAVGRCAELPQTGLQQSEKREESPFQGLSVRVAEQFVELLVQRTPRRRLGCIEPHRRRHIDRHSRHFGNDCLAGLLGPALDRVEGSRETDPGRTHRNVDRNLGVELVEEPDDRTWLVLRVHVVHEPRDGVTCGRWWRTKAGRSTVSRKTRGFLWCLCSRIDLGLVFRGRCRHFGSVELGLERCGVRFRIFGCSLLNPGLVFRCICRLHRLELGRVLCGIKHGLLCHGFRRCCLELGRLCSVGLDLELRTVLLRIFGLLFLCRVCRLESDLALLCRRFGLPVSRSRSLARSLSRQLRGPRRPCAPVPQPLRPLGVLPASRQLRALVPQPLFWPRTSPRTAELCGSAQMVRRWRTTPPCGHRGRRQSEERIQSHSAVDLRPSSHSS
eukprot:m.106320 g.106320  ORF g.106320 m.106320 type:complete len:401 (+) comp21083_c0_seq2:419-1621(+)